MQSTLLTDSSLVFVPVEFAIYINAAKIARFVNGKIFGIPAVEPEVCK